MKCHLAFIWLPVWLLLLLFQMKLASYLFLPFCRWFIIMKVQFAFFVFCFLFFFFLFFKWKLLSVSVHVWRVRFPLNLYLNRIEISPLAHHRLFLANKKRKGEHRHGSSSQKYSNIRFVWLLGWAIIIGPLSCNGGGKFGFCLLHAIRFVLLVSLFLFYCTSKWETFFFFFFFFVI